MEGKAFNARNQARGPKKRRGGPPFSTLLWGREGGKQSSREKVLPALYLHVVRSEKKKEERPTTPNLCEGEKKARGIPERGSLPSLFSIPEKQGRGGRPFSSPVKDRKNPHRRSRQGERGQIYAEAEKENFSEEAPLLAPPSLQQKRKEKGGGRTSHFYHFKEREKKECHLNRWLTASLYPPRNRCPRKERGKMSAFVLYPTEKKKRGLSRCRFSQSYTR